MQVPDQDKQIYDRLAPTLDRGQVPAKVERLLPPPEAPMAPPRVPDPPPQTAEQIPLLNAPPTTPKIGSAPELMKPRDSVEAPSLNAPSQPKASAPSQAPTTAKEAAKVAAVAPASGGYRVQIASLRTPEDAETTIARMKKANGDLFAGLSFDVKRADLPEKGVYYRVQVGPLADASAATGLCDRLKDRKVGCVIVRP
jgi:cell division protein FtsN